MLLLGTLGHESIVLAARELLVLALVVGVILWVAYQLVRTHTDRQ
jgi:hypothetical protein